jgi:hypothetical protein
VIIDPKRARRCTLHQYGNARSLQFKINDDSEFVDSYKHFGHVINSVFDDDDNIEDKRAVFIGQENYALCYFGKLSAHVNNLLPNLKL